MLITNAEEFGKCVYTSRKLSRLTQREVAAASGTGIRFIRDLENGKKTCVLEKSLRVAFLLGIKLEMKMPTT